MPASRPPAPATDPAHPAARWQGWAAITPGRLYYGGQIGAADLHAHHAAQLLIGDGLVLRDADGAEHAMTAAFIPANTPHAIVRGASGGLLALIDPAQAGPVRAHPRLRSAAGWAVELDVPAVWDLPTLHALADRLTGAAPACPRHPALIHATQVIDSLLPARVRLAEVARAVHLSDSRLSHLFTSQLGLPFRPYVLWMRLRMALSPLADGATLTEAAHAAGFADAAHLTRVVRRMMGQAPSTLAAGVQWLTVAHGG
ncbi:helix-turn-helix transcriptional regulator [Bailinhaonella thermotolerans]|uniref:AraC family transcriptional regulator n=1 Tax=Bailinhaonella thermotolerans TaxID=1070861 RepID=A0A3A4A7G2_9ACTN|nr:AraC family transcriptional regulator [Bailinhaonella thermotolerans]RJL23931.1 AraC family transcriptional regulator [Bailinhaonella thermotolerans]